MIQLDKFDNREYRRGRSVLVQMLWLLAEALFLRSFIPGSAHRRLLLRAFGARIGAGVVIKPGVRVKFPWRFAVGDYSWIGEGAWIDNLADVRIGAHCCISQEAYICTGSHDWSKPTFDLIVKPIEVRNGAWIAARAVLGPGVVVGEGAILSLGSVATSSLEPWAIYQGQPAQFVKRREIGTIVAPAEMEMI